MAVKLAVAAGEHDRRVLVVDVDLQADATTMLGVDPTPSLAAAHAGDRDTISWRR